VSVGVRGGGRHRGIIHAVLRIGGRGAGGPTATPGTPGGPHVVYLSLLTDSSIDALPKQVGVPTVARVLLDPVHPELPNRESLFSQTLTKVHVLGQRVVGPRLLANQVRTGSVNNGLIRVRSLEGRITLAVQLRLRIAMADPVTPVPLPLGEVPSSDIVDGGTDRRAICCASSPSHFICKVSR